MPESKLTPTPDAKKPDAPTKAPGTSPANEQKPPAAQAPQAQKNAAPAEKKPNDLPKEPPKGSTAPPTTPPPPPPKAPPKEPVTKSKQADDKGKSAAEPKKAVPSTPSSDDKKPAVEEKAGEKKSESKAAVPVPKAPTPAEPKKPVEKKPDDKKPEAKSPAADSKGKPADTPKKEDAKGPITVSGKGKVEIPLEPKPDEKAATPKSADMKASAPPAAGEAPLTPAQKAGQTRKEHTQATKDFLDGKATLDGKPIEPLQSVPAGKPKDETSVGPAQQAEGPKGIVITQVFDDRLAPPTEADLKNLPIPKEGEAFSMRLHPAYFFEFLEHPFTINRETKDYKDLYESIKENGIHDPVYVRPREKGGLEIMSGHRRHDIGAQLNYPIPTIIVHADDDTARIAVVDGNLHRMDIPTSELARAAKMKMEALGRKQGRRSKMDQLSAPQKRSDQQVAEDMGMSRNQVQRLVRIDSLVPELKQQVDDKKLPFNTAVELSYMKPEEQQKVVDFMAKEQVTPSMAQATELKEASKHAATLEKYTPSLAPEHKVDEKKIESIMKPKQEPELKITLKGSDLKPYFPDKLPPASEIKQAIFDGLGLRKKAMEKQAKKQEARPPAR